MTVPAAVPFAHPEYRFVDLAVGGVAKRNRIVEVGEIPTLVPAGVEAYATYYRFRDDLAKHVEETGSVAGFRGPCFADCLPLDIDDTDLDEARARLVRLLATLEADHGVRFDDLAVYFSGAKGFHVLVPTTLFGEVAPGFRVPEIWRAIARDLSGDVEIDLAVYDRTRLFRLPSSRHPKTGLVKVRLDRGLVEGPTDAIREWAGEVRPDSSLPAPAPNSSLVALYRKHATEPPRPTVPATPRPTAPGGPGHAALDLSSIPPRTKLCYRHLLVGCGEGGRDNAALRLAVFFRKEGYDAALAEAAILAWNSRNDPPLPEGQVRDKIRRAFAAGASYDFGCFDPVLDAACDPRCYLHLAKKRGDRGAEVSGHAPAAVPAYDYRQAGEAYRDFIANLAHRRVHLGLGTLDDVMRGIAPGEVCQILARTSVGKTMILQNVLHRIDASGAPTVFFSLEMPLVSVFERAAQMTLGHSGQEVEALFADPERAARAIEDVYKAHPRIYVVPRSRLGLPEIGEITRRLETERLTGVRVAAIGIDYLGLLDGKKPNRDVYEAVSEHARGLKDLAKDLDVAVVSLHQTSRQGSIDEPVRLDMGRDSGAIEEAADFILGAHRPNFEQDDDYVTIKILKNRKGALAEAHFDFDRRTLRLTERGATVARKTEAPNSQAPTRRLQ